MNLILKDNAGRDTAYGEVYSHQDSRICFGVIYYATEEEADRAGSRVTGTYNEGMFDGLPCGRKRDSDYTDKDTGQRYFAVTTP